MISQSVAADLKRIVGPENVVLDEPALDYYSVDAYGRWRGAPLAPDAPRVFAVARPCSTEEVAEVVKLATPGAHPYRALRRRHGRGRRGDASHGRHSRGHEANESHPGDKPGRQDGDRRSGRHPRRPEQRPCRPRPHAGPRPLQRPHSHHWRRALHQRRGLQGGQVRLNGRAGAGPGGGSAHRGDAPHKGRDQDVRGAIPAPAVHRGRGGLRRHNPGPPSGSSVCRNPACSRLSPFHNSRTGSGQCWSCSRWASSPPSST